MEKTNSKIRISTHRQDTPHFRHDGLEVGPGWTDLDLDAISPETHKAFIDHLDRFVKVHPHDEEKLKALGVLKDEKTGKYSDEARSARLALPTKARQEADAAVARAAAAKAALDNGEEGRAEARDQAADALESTVAEHTRTKRDTASDRGGKKS